MAGIPVIAAAQLEDEALFSAHLAWLVEKPYQRAVVIAAWVVGRMLARGGVILQDLAAPGAAPTLSVLTA